ncbi:MULTISPECIES: hypothetical protein [unclassified Geodermatophilus]
MAEAAQAAIDAAQRAAEEAARAAQEAAQEAQEAADQATQAAQDAADEASQAAQDAAEAAGGAAQGSADAVDDEDGDAAPDEVDWLPQDLQDDLADLQDLPADQRAEEVEQVLRDAVAGEYGERVEDWAERTVDLMDDFPPDLRSDLQDLLSMRPDAAQERLRQVWQGVQDGDYGQDVEMWGRWLQQTSQRWDLGQLLESTTDTGATNAN